ncbi:MAG: hypothetical protein HY318_12535 [Armatimonadetes bacterium]|nr:hypothetical protein [Armatimonadota bacterium]
MRLLGLVPAITSLVLAMCNGSQADRVAPPNQGFEQIAGDKPVAWTCSGQPKGFDWSVTAEEHRSGKGALSIRLTSHADVGRIEITSETAQVTPGKLVRLSGWYKSVGWSGKGNLWSQTMLLFYDDSHKLLATRDGSFLEIPYASTDAWKFAEMTGPAPDTAREARIVVVVHCYDASKEVSPALFVDDMDLQDLEIPEPRKEARRWTYMARAYGVELPTEALPDSHSGGAIHARVGVDHVGGLISGPLIPDQGPGLFRATFRLRVSDNSKPDQVCTIYTASNGVLNSHSMRSRTLLANEFKQPRQFEEFSIDFLRPPRGGMQYLCTWYGKVDLWVDTFTVTELKRLPDRELVTMYGEVLGGDVKPDSNGGLFVLRGPFFPFYRLDEVARELGTTVTRLACISTPGGNSLLTPPFPTDPTELSGLRAVVLTDVDAEGLGFQGRDALRKFVDAGGVLVVLGGWLSYGGSKMESTFLEEMLPVTVNHPFDRAFCSPPAALVPAADWQAGKPLPWSQKPCVLWLHQLTPKPTAEVLIQAGGKPFLIAGSYGRGRVVACAGTVLGSAPPGAMPFWDWQAWPKALSLAVQ